MEQWYIARMVGNHPPDVPRWKTALGIILVLAAIAAVVSLGLEVVELLFP